MLQSIPDPFDSYGPPKPEDQIFSILAPLSIFNASASPSPRAGAAEIDPMSNLASPNDISWSSDHDDMDNAASQWADVHTPTSSPPLSAKSTATVTMTNATSPPSSSRRASYPTGSGGSPLSPGRSPGGIRKADSKLRKSLSAIHEAASSESSSVSRSSFESKSRLPSVTLDNHERESSSDTLRQPNSEANKSINGSRNAFADDPIWGSHETSSSMTLRGDENRKDSSINGSGRDSRELDPELSGSGPGQG